MQDSKRHFSIGFYHGCDHVVIDGTVSWACNLTEQQAERLCNMLNDLELGGQTRKLFREHDRIAVGRITRTIEAFRVQESLALEDILGSKLPNREDVISNYKRALTYEVRHAQTLRD